MNIDRYKQDIKILVSTGRRLLYAMMVETKHPQAKEFSKEDRETFPNFRASYQTWYSEAIRAVTQLLPDRLDDFISHYKPIKSRKNINYETYTVSDYLKSLTRDNIVEPSAAVPVLYQQVQIVEAMERRFESSLFDIQALVQADLFDDELDTAEELNKKGYSRGAGAIAGVVLEGHLGTVCNNHKITVPKNPTIAKLYDLLKQADVLDIPTWRFIQHLGDLRNLCDHNKGVEPGADEIHELIAGTRKITKTVF